MGIVIAIDGPSGAGKTSTARAIARRAGWSYLDTGALYRGMTWLSLREKSQDPAVILKALKNSPIKCDIDPNEPKIFAGDVDITAEIRSSKVTDLVSELSANSEIRAALFLLQHKIIGQASGGIVVEGRDIGTVVMPDAALKIFLTADLKSKSLPKRKTPMKRQAIAGKANSKKTSCLTGICLLKT